MQKIAYLFINLFLSFYSLLSFIVPLRFWIFIGRVYGTFFFCISRRHKKIAITNLNFIFEKDKNQKEIRDIAKKSFQEFGMIFQEYVRLKYLKTENLERLVEVENIEHLENAKKKNRAIILVSAHFGNWEYGSSLYGSKINRINFFVKKIPNLHIEKLRVKINNKFNLNVLYKQKGLMPAVKNMKKGEDLFILPDQNANLKTGVRSFFLGKEIASLKIVATLSEKFDFPVVPFFIIRQKNRTHHKMVFLPELNFKDENGKFFDVKTNIQTQNSIIEKMIKKHPEHWLWFHRKWLYLYPEIYNKERYHKDFPS